MPRIGSISHGTLRTEDLFQAFLAELEDCDPAAATERKELWLEELTRELEDQAPPYTYFGTHEGDGSDFGFWPDMEAINDLPRLKDGPAYPPLRAQAIALNKDCAYVNDHGNVTVYSSTGEIILEIV